MYGNSNHGHNGVGDRMGVGGVGDVGGEGGGGGSNICFRHQRPTSGKDVIIKLITMRN